MNTLAVSGTLVGLVIAAGGWLAWDQFAGPRCEGDLVEGAMPAAGTIRLQLVLHNNVTAAPVRACLFAADGTKLYDQVHEAHGDAARLWDVHVAQRPEVFVAHEEGRGGMDLDDLGGYLATDGCNRGTPPEYLYSTYYELIHVDCDVGTNHPKDLRIQRAGPSSFAAIPAAETSARGGGGPGAAAGVALTGTIAVGAVAVWLRRPLRWLLVGLFTRILAPKALDQRVRAEIHQLVQGEPGIRPAEIAERLELGAGQTTHHLRVLVRSNALTLVRLGMARHYFVHGVLSPDRMRQLAALRSDPIARLHRALVENPGAPLSTLANRGGLSRPRASRLARRLQELGLARAERRGKTVRLHPLDRSG